MSVDKILISVNSGFMTARKPLLTVLLVFTVYMLHAQTVQRDAGLWLGTSGEYEINDRISLDGELEMRMHQQFSRYHALLLDLGGSYKIDKNWSVGAAYRLGHRLRLDNRQDFRRRFNTDVKYRFKTGDTKIDFRLRYQAGRNRSEEQLSDLRNALRFRAKVSHKLAKRTYLAASGELFYGSRRGEFMMTDWRFRLMLERRLGKGRSITGGYLVQREVNRNRPLLENVLTLSYSFGIN